VIRTPLLLAALAAAACGKGPAEGAPCDEVGTNFLALAHADLRLAADAGAVDPETRGDTESHLPAIRDSIVRHCKEDGWSAATRDCFASARSADHMTRCYEALPPEHRDPLDKASAGSR
jgi:hypothetical protein